TGAYSLQFSGMLFYHGIVHVLPFASYLTTIYYPMLMIILCTSPPTFGSDRRLIRRGGVVGVHKTKQQEWKGVTGNRGVAARNLGSHEMKETSYSDSVNSSNR
ncbi:LMBR1 domain-containing protein 2, partial [Lates japonicus]